MSQYSASSQSKYSRGPRYRDQSNVSQDFFDQQSSEGNFDDHFDARRDRNKIVEESHEQDSSRSNESNRDIMDAWDIGPSGEEKPNNL